MVPLLHIFISFWTLLVPLAHEFIYLDGPHPQFTPGLTWTIQLQYLQDYLCAMLVIHFTQSLYFILSTTHIVLKIDIQQALNSLLCLQPRLLNAFFHRFVFVVNIPLSFNISNISKFPHREDNCKVSKVAGQKKYFTVEGPNLAAKGSRSQDKQEE